MFAVWLVASEALLRTQVLPYDNLNRQVRLFHATQDARALFVGDSHTSQDIDAPPGTLNLALAGDRFADAATKVRAWLATHPAPELVVVQVSAQMFASHRVHEPRPDWERYLAPGGDVASRPLVFEPLYRARLARFWWLLVMRGGVLRTEFTPQGSVLTDAVMPAVSDRYRLEVQNRIDQHVVPDDILARPVDEEMHGLISELKARGIRVCLVTLPVTPVYRELAAPWPSFAAAHAFFAELSAEQGVPWFDYTDAIRDPAAFRNMDHLNRRGAAELTARVVEDCGVPGTDNP
ncbi:MAG: hypothetical protein R3F61_02065 [Myxococcota bacterium]